MRKQRIDSIMVWNTKDGPEVTVWRTGNTKQYINVTRSTRSRLSDLSYHDNIVTRVAIHKLETVVFLKLKRV